MSPSDDRRRQKLLLEKTAPGAHRGNEAREPSDPPARESIEIEVEDDRAERRAMKPWWRRTVDWVVDLHKGVIAIAGIAGVSVVAHAWIRGLVSKDEVHDEVKRAVTEAMTESNARLVNLETNTAGLPAWRGTTQETIVTHNVQILGLLQHVDKLDDRLERVRPR